MKADVTSPVKILRMREETGPVDILVNNAGIPTSGFQLKKFVDTSPEDWEADMRLNLGAVLHVTHAYVGAMVEAGWGRVVTVVSDAGRKGERMQAIYGSAKSGAMGFTRGLAAEVGAARRDRQLRVARHDEDGRVRRRRSSRTPTLEQRLARHYPVPRVGEPERPRRPWWRCSAATPPRWITGQVYPVDGGYVSAL